MILCFRLLLQQGNKVGDKDQAGNTPLHLAAEVTSETVHLYTCTLTEPVLFQAGNKEAARVLLHHGASAADRNTAGLSALHVAAKNKHGPVAELLLQHMGQQWGGRPLYKCTQHKTSSVLGGMAGSVDMVTTIGARPPLHIASAEGAVNVTQALLGAGGECPP